MEPTPQLLLSHLPEYRDEWVLVTRDQSVNDIIKDVVTRHREFAPYYDNIALFFDRGDLAETCEGLYRFCKKYLRYREEPEDFQSTAAPQGLLTRGFCDCKGYSSFIAGCLDGIRRATGKKIDWVYRFASYNALNSSPHHVFIVVNDPQEGETWIDPTPRARDMSPAWQLDKSVKMPLYSNIAGFGPSESRAVGIASITVSPVTSAGSIWKFQGAPWPFAVEPFRYFLGLDQYRDYSGDRNINESSVAASLNSLVAKGPSPGHAIDPAFVKWVYDNSIRSWNFYYPGGVDPNFDETPFIPKTYNWTDAAGHVQTIVPPHWVVTADHRVTIDHDVKLDDYRNWLIHILTAAAQKYINQYDASPFPLKPADLKNFSQAYTGNPNNPAASILREWRASSDVTKFIDKTTSFITNIAIKVIGAVPRNAFLALVGLNVFRMATDLQHSIDAGKWSAIADKWSKLGGDPDKLRNTISHGSGLPEVDDVNQTVTSGDQITGASIGNPAVIAAALAAAVPIITAFLNYFSHSSLHSTSQSYVDALNTQNPAGHYTLVNGELYSNGQPVTMQGETGTDAANRNLLLVSAAVAGASYFLFNWKRKGKKKRIVLPLAIGAGTYFLMKRRAAQALPTYPTGTIAPTNQPGTGLTSILTSIQNLLTSSGNNPTATEATPSGIYQAGDAVPLNPDLAGGQYVAGYREQPEPYFND